MCGIWGIIGLNSITKTELKNVRWIKSTNYRINE